MQFQRSSNMQSLQVWWYSTQICQTWCWKPLVLNCHCWTQQQHSWSLCYVMRGQRQRYRQGRWMLCRGRGTQGGILIALWSVFGLHVDVKSSLFNLTELKVPGEGNSDSTTRSFMGTLWTLYCERVKSIAGADALYIRCWDGESYPSNHQDAINEKPSHAHSQTGTGTNDCH